MSILIPSVPERHEHLMRLLGGLSARSRDFIGEVEVLALTDLKTMSLGEKRNRLMQIATGLYCINLDDDDALTVDALSVLVPLLREINEMELGSGYSFPDVIAYDQQCRLELEGGVVAEFRVRTSIDFENEAASQKDGVWQDIKRKPWHWCCFRTELARQFKFVGRVDEDWQWLQKILPACRKQHKIDKVLHLYNFSAKNSLCKADENASS